MYGDIQLDINLFHQTPDYLLTEQTNYDILFYVIEHRTNKGGICK